ncbi:MAG: DUF1501 domain-containing protein [Planctomycetes bacterium]|nr:DUF1501 domain-containing protein [Planctomycetota bacterium]
MSRIPITTRRDLLTCGLGLVGVSAALPDFLIRSALADPAPASQDPSQVAVIIEMSGGNDTLSTVIPHSSKTYAEGRKTTRIPENEIIKINDEFGFHPKLQGFKALLDEGRMAILPGVGHPQPNYSHFSAMDIWHVADERGRCPEVPYGWIGRAVDSGFGEASQPILAVAVGPDKAPPAFKGPKHAGISFRRPESFRYTGDKDDAARAALYKRLHEHPSAPAGENLDFLSRTALAANVSSEEIRRLASSYEPKVEYPKTGLARNLRAIAGLVKGGLGTRVYYTMQGGYDTHSNQRQQHDRLLSELNDAVAAFQHDLAQQGQDGRVLTLTFSEFSRNVKENGSQGTDHGHAGAMFFFGTKLKPGFRGAYPSLEDVHQVRNGALKHNVDFRSVYTTVLEKWIGVPAAPALGPYPIVDLFA